MIKVAMARTDEIFGTRKVAELVAQGLTNRQIADKLFIGVDTVKKHLSRVLAAAGCTSRTLLAARYADNRQATDGR